LIPVPIVLVKIINGKFGIIEYLRKPQGYFGHFVDQYDVIYVENKGKEQRREV
jgi:hypothetical protein